MDALRASLANVRMGDLATQQSNDQRIRDYGTKLKGDFSTHTAEIQQLLMSLDVPSPTQLSTEAISHLAALTRLSGEEFDMAFVQQMIWTHTDAIERYGAQTQRTRIARCTTSQPRACRCCASTWSKPKRYAEAIDNAARCSARPASRAAPE